jgi:hypothetical protein
LRVHARAFVVSRQTRERQDSNSDFYRLALSYFCDILNLKAGKPSAHIPCALQAGMPANPHGICAAAGVLNFFKRGKLSALLLPARWRRKVDYCFSY